MKKFTKFVCFAVLAAAIAAAPAVYAQDASTNTTATAKKPKAKAHKGTVASVDNDGKTITLKDDSKKITITSATKITKSGQPATLADIMVGDAVSISGKEDAATGMINATSIRVGKKKATE